MLARDVAILAKMQRAHVPPYAYKTSLAKEGQSTFSKIIAKKEYSRSHGGYVSYAVRRPAGSRRRPDDVVKTCAVAAKELVLNNVNVLYTTATELSMAYQVYERGSPESIFSSIERVGTGYFVIGDIGENTANLAAVSWDQVQTLLGVHLSRGGALILGFTASTVLRHDFQLAVADFTKIDVV